MSDWIPGDPLDESSRFTLEELCRICGVQEELVIEIVEEGVVEPLGDGRGQWRFTGRAVTRIQRVIRLQRDFEVNLPGAALALELLEEIDRLRRGGSA
jgi:chaperone modulatory protein CbpM